MIKVCVDCKPYPYTVDDLKTFVAEAANAGLKVAGQLEVREPILGGSGQISGGLTAEQARDIANRLASGAAKLDFEVAD